MELVIHKASTCTCEALPKRKFFCCGRWPLAVNIIEICRRVRVKIVVYPFVMITRVVNCNCGKFIVGFSIAHQTHHQSCVVVLVCLFKSFFRIFVGFWTFYCARHKTKTICGWLKRVQVDLFARCASRWYVEVHMARDGWNMNELCDRILGRRLWCVSCWFIAFDLLHFQFQRHCLNHNIGIPICIL